MENGPPVDAATRTAIEKSLCSIIEFVTSSPFSAVLDEFWLLDQEGRKSFVRDVLLNSHALRLRGVELPHGMILQRSAFRDNRPTLFCITKYLPEGLPWRKVTITFDNLSGEPAVKYDELAAADAGAPA